MDLSTPFATHLSALTDGVGTEHESLTDTLATLVADLRAAVSSYSGLRLTLVRDGWPVTLTAFPGADGKPPATSLRVTLSTLGGGFEPDSEIVLYARTPGAFVDLAADLAYLDRRGRTPYPAHRSGEGNTPVDAGRHPAGPALDGDLPPVSVVSGLSGMLEYSTINRAVGVLMWRGQTTNQALGTLRREATAGGLSVPGYAALLLEE